MRYYFILFAFIGITAGYRDTFQIGVILQKDDEVSEKIIDNVLWKFLSQSQQQISYQTAKEKISIEDPFHYHAAMCKLLKKGVGVFVTSLTPSNLPVLGGYANDYHISLLSPSLMEAPEDPKAEDLRPKSMVPMEPSTTRAMLDVIRDFRWQELVYIYDHDYVPEKLQKMFRVGYSALHLKLVGFAKVKTADEAINFLRKIDQPGQNRQVILDTDLELASSILRLHVHHTGIMKKNFHFIISRPVLETFWMTNEFGAIRITGFLALTPNLNRFSNAKGEWMKLIGHQSLNRKEKLNIHHYYTHDAAQFLSYAIRGVRPRNPSRSPMPTFPSENTRISDCVPRFVDDRISQVLRQVRVEEGLTGRIEFSDFQQSRVNVNLTVVESAPYSYREVGSWSDFRGSGGFRRSVPLQNDEPGALPQTSSRNSIFRITTKISPPFVMLDENGTFEGYCIDIMEQICNQLQVRCELQLVKDGLYGNFEPQRGRWSGMIGEILDGTADIALGDLIVTSRRQRVVEFTDPFDIVSASVLMPSPEPERSILRAFSAGAWVCVILAAFVCAGAFHALSKVAGAPDSVLSLSGIWGRMSNITLTAWWTVGAATMQGSGVYPRSISSRLLAVSWWWSTTLFICFYIASFTAQLQMQKDGSQLAQLKTLSMETVLRESLASGWPKIGILKPGITARYIENSNLPLYKQLQEYFKDNPDQVLWHSISEGIERVRSGGHVFLTDSLQADYALRRAPCGRMLSAHDDFGFAAYAIGLAPQLDKDIVKNISDAIVQMHDDGVLGQLYQKWWVEASQCKEDIVEESSLGTLNAVSGAVYLFLVFLAVTLVIFVIQFSRRIKDKESRRQQLTFDDMNLDNRLPTPPPEMLSQPPPVLNAPEIDNRDRNDTTGSETFKDFFERMRSSP
ncbi:hypothetical protein JTE90_016808 [Oedothorax gibbosus]|uniref:Glutamate receptor ionotropic, kainate 2 n=1 Tax=Oedothorax gibbosus TaxID=931172 RepID=A0AAV6W0G5_9ARAC|nr:hypothetical protein JTE90_016808 [Oedothorax gibbosus]